jgi:hypothetical protein
MFGKKKPPKPGRQRPQAGTERRSSVVFSYHANSRSARPSSGNPVRDLKAQQKEAKKSPVAVRRSKQINWLKRGPAILALALAGVLLLNSLFLSSQPRIIQTGDGRGQIFLRNESTYQQAATDILGSSLLNRTKLTIDTGNMAQKLSSEFPELGSVTVALPVFGHQPVVRIEPASPALILTTASGQSYVLDAAGRALITPAQAPGVSRLGLPVVTDQSGLLITTGHIALPSGSVGFISEVVGQSRAAHVTISSLTLPKGTSELDMRVSGVAYYVKFSVRGDARGEAGTFLAVKQQLERDHKTPSIYLDVRVDGRAYYK